MPTNLTRLRQLIQEHFSVSEIKVLCHDLDIKFENVPGSTLAEKALELVEYCRRQGKLPQLCELCRQEHPTVDWNEACQPAIADANQPDDDLPFDTYLKLVRTRSKALPLISPMQGSLTAHDIAPPRFFVPLNVSLGEIENDDALPGSRRQSVFDTLAGQRCLVLLGRPGAGKSTVVSMLIYCLADACLSTSPTERQQALRPLGREWMTNPLVPVYISLRDFAAWLERPNFIPPKFGSMQLVWNYLADVLNVSHDSQTITQLQHAAKHEGCLFLCDGLDEVRLNIADVQPEKPDVLPLVRQCIEDLGKTTSTNTHVLVTCRVRDYGQAERRLPAKEWPVARIEPLSAEKQRLLVQKWSQILIDQYRLNKAIAARAQQLEDRLSKSQISSLARTPLLLWMMLQLQLYHGRLPDQRVQLYEECITFLISQWRSPSDSKGLRQQRGFEDWNDQQLLELLSLIAHTAHAAQRQAGDRSGEGALDFNDTLLVQAVQSYFTHTLQSDARTARERAITFSAFVRLDSNNTIQVQQQIGQRDIIYQFPHRTFHEYLAGRALANSALLLDGEQPENEADLATRVERIRGQLSHWHEPLLLAASYCLRRRDVAAVIQMVFKLLPQRFTARTNNDIEQYVLAGELLQEVGWKRCAQDKERESLWQKTRSQLQRALTERAAGPLVRERIGLLLAQLGAGEAPGDTRPGVCSLDMLWSKSFRGGQYRLPSTQTQVTAAEFAIACYPVTVWQFRRFVRDQGYETEAWWQNTGLNRSEIAKLRESERFDSSDTPFDNQPTRAVTWHEASTFCKWLTQHARTAGNLAEGWVIRLPTEAEWELAAMVDPAIPADRHPEGASPQTEPRVNEIGRPAPVGLFPEHASPCGAYDMAGNVWEWCSTAFEDWPPTASISLSGVSLGSNQPVVRGGLAWDSRDPLSADEILNDVGFRVVRARS